MSEIALIGKKIGMTREFYKTGQLVPVTKAWALINLQSSNLGFK